MPNHPEWQVGRHEIAAEGDAGRRHAEIAAASYGSIARSAPCGAAAPLPEGPALQGAPNPASTGLPRQPVGAKGLPQSKHGHVPNALTCAFAPLAGLEPAPYG
jgi:hypothetical protein